MFHTNVDRCYVDDSNTCQDEKPSKSRPGWVWSCEACTHQKKKSPESLEITDLSESLESSEITHGKKKDQGCRRRKRKNVNSLSRAEKDKLVAAINRLIESGRYVELGNIHGGPEEANVCPGKTEMKMVKQRAGGCCRHETRNFLNWHRLFIAHVEDELGEALPYWDWTVDRKVPDLWEGIKAPLYSPFTSRCEP